MKQDMGIQATYNEHGQLNGLHILIETDEQAHAWAPALEAIELVLVTQGYSETESIIVDLRKLLEPWRQWVRDAMQRITKRQAVGDDD